MTIASRNRFIRIAALFSLALLITSITGIILICIHNGLPSSAHGTRPLAILGKFKLTPYSSLASMIAIGLYPFYSLVFLLYILIAFEKTQTVEIIFFAAFTFSVALEAFRIFIPLYQLWNNSSFYSVTISRIAYCSRILTVLFLLSSSIFTTRKSIQQLGPIIFLLAFLAFSLAYAIPANSGTINSNFLVTPGYSSMLNLFFFILVILCTVSYLIMGKTLGVKEYYQAAGGLILLLAGYSILAACDTWVFLAFGTFLLFWGTRIYLDRLHRYYLWQ